MGLGVLDFIIIALIAIGMILVFVREISRKKQGKSGCGCNCESCGKACKKI